MNKKRRVLIVDKDEGVLIALERLLEDEGFDTTTTWSAREALEYVVNEGCEVLVIGDQLPDLSCEQFLREAQRQGAPPVVVVLASSAPRVPAMASYLMSLGATSAVRKRNLGEVVEQVKALSARFSGAAARAA